MENHNNGGLGRRLVLIQPYIASVFKKRPKVWMEMIVEACSNQSDMDTNAVILQLMRVLAEMDVTALDQVAVSMSNVLKDWQLKNLSVWQQVAMFDESKVGVSAQRIIRKHLLQAGCNLLIPENTHQEIQCHPLAPNHH